jgi:hypothetical protein
MKRKFMLWLMQTRLYAYLMNHVVWRLRLSNYYTSFTGAQYHSGYEKLQPGMFILCVDNHKLVNAVVDGTFSHAALCVAKGTKYLIEPNRGAMNALATYPPEIVELVHEGYNKAHFFDVCKESDRVAIFDCRDWSADHKASMVDSAKLFENCSYDIHFTLGVEALYCSELIYQCDLEAGGGANKLQVSLADLAGLGRPYISPDGLAKALNSICVWDSANELTGLTGAEIKARGLLG